MKGEKVRELFRKTSVKTCSVILATALVFGGSYWADHQAVVPELVTFVDMDGTIQIEEDEVPLNAPQVSKSTKTKKKTKKIRMKKASKKTYSKKGKTTTKRDTKKASTAAATTTTETTTQTSVLNKYKKGSKINTQVTTVKTVVTKTVMSNSPGAPSTDKKAEKAENTGALGSKADSRVMNAFNTLGFKFNVNAGVGYSGLFDARSRTITMKKADDTVYHELGHFVAFIAGNVDKTPQFQQIFAKEKSKYTAFNKAYVLSSSSEYFAESFRNYTLDPDGLNASRPETYKAIQSALSAITDAQVARVASVYGAIWK